MQSCTAHKTAQNSSASIVIHCLRVSTKTDLFLLVVSARLLRVKYISNVSQSNIHGLQLLINTTFTFRNIAFGYTYTRNYIYPTGV